MKRSDGGKEEKIEERAASNKGIPRGRLALGGKMPAGLSLRGCRGRLLTLQEDTSSPEPEPGEDHLH